MATADLDIPLSNDFVVPTHAQIGATSQLDGIYNLVAFVPLKLTSYMALYFPRKQVHVSVRQFPWTPFQVIVPARPGRTECLGNTVGFGLRPL